MGLEIAERNIGTVAQWARANLLHLACHWPAHASVRLWPFAIAYAVWVFNCLPSLSTGICPNEIWFESRFAHEDFHRAHVFGCPTFVLEPKLQDGKKIPKWAPRARLGMFLGFSPSHSSLVPLVLNLCTGKVSPQYHVIFDDKFETVHSLPDGESLDKQWERLFKLGREFYLDEEFNEAGELQTSHFPDLEKDWVDPTLQLDTSRGAYPRPLWLRSTVTMTPTVNLSSPPTSLHPLRYPSYLPSISPGHPLLRPLRYPS